MPDSVREAALQALLAALQGIFGVEVHRETTLPQEVPAGGLLILRDGSPGDPTDVEMSPPAYSYEHEAQIEAFVPPDAAGRHTDLDQLLQQVHAAIDADRTLGGAVEYAETQAPQTDDFGVEGAPPFKAAIAPVTLAYTTADPLT